MGLSQNYGRVLCYTWRVVLWKLSVIFENKVAFVDFGTVNMWFNITQI